jgi:hypothetical protein
VGVEDIVTRVLLGLLGVALIVLGVAWFLVERFARLFASRLQPRVIVVDRRAPASPNAAVRTFLVVAGLIVAAAIFRRH